MNEKKYYAYIVTSDSGTLYIGVTSNLRVRVMQHKHGKFDGFSKEYGCNRLVYWEGFDDVTQAIHREKQLKGWRRSKKIGLIETKNPRWEDLAEKWGAEMVFAREPIAGRD